MTKKAQVKVPKYTKAEIAELSEKVIALGKLGTTARVIGLEIGLSSLQISELRAKEPELDVAFQAAHDFALGHWEREISLNVGNKSYNSQLVGTFLRGSFPSHFESATYKVAKERDIQASETSAMSHDQYQAEVQKLIAELSAAG